MSKSRALTDKQLARINLGSLHPAIGRLVSYLGEQLAFKLIELRGGQMIKIPKRAKLEHPLAQDLGLKNMAKLCEAYGNQEVSVPKNDKLFQQLRHRRVIELLDKGATLNQAAAETGYTKRHVCNIAKGNLEDMAYLQPDLFRLSLDEDSPAELPSAGAHNPWGYGPSAAQK